MCWNLALSTDTHARGKLIGPYTSPIGLWTQLEIVVGRWGCHAHKADQTDMHCQFDYWASFTRMVQRSCDTKRLLPECSFILQGDSNAPKALPLPEIRLQAGKTGLLHSRMGIAFGSDR